MKPKLGVEQKQVYHGLWSRQIFAQISVQLSRKKSKENDQQKKKIVPRWAQDSSSTIFCPNFTKPTQIYPNLPENNYIKTWTSKKMSSLSFLVPFLENNRTYSDFATICTYFAQISSHFSRIFTNSRLLGVRWHLLQPVTCTFYP